MPANILARAASKLNFAHLTGASKKSEDKDDEKEKAEDKDDEQEDQNRDDGDAQSSSASDDDDDDKDDDKEKEKKSKKSKKADDDEPDAEDDDDDEEMRGSNACAQARIRERARCAAILSSDAAARNIELACSLAFETTLPREQAIAVLSKSGSKTPMHAGRSARNPTIGAGGRPEANSPQAIAASWDAQMKKAKGNPRH
jgi:hypothetical protein